MKLKKVLLAGSIILGASATYLYGPNVIQTLYLNATPESVMQNQRKEYSRLEEAEIHLSGSARTEVQKQRHKLYLWFHARGFPIDEGDGEVSSWQPWQDLIDYWDDDDGARFFSPIGK